VAHLAWRAQPPDESAEEREDAPHEDAEIVDLTKLRLLGWFKGLFAGGKRGAPPDDR
jgi:hypothetical protein